MDTVYITVNIHTVTVVADCGWLSFKYMQIFQHVLYIIRQKNAAVCNEVVNYQLWNLAVMNKYRTKLNKIWIHISIKNYKYSVLMAGQININK